MTTPALALNFLSGSLDPLITFTRAGATATRVNASGLVETVAADTPRFDYTPVTLAARGLLVEGQTNNICTYSQDFTNGGVTGWGAINLTPSANTTVSPDGTQNADSLFETAANAQHRLDKVLVNAAGDYTFSCFIKSAGSRYASIRISGVGAYIDLNNGAVVNVGATTFGAVNYGNGWYRLYVGVAGVLANTTIRINNNGASGGIAATYVGNPANAMVCWGAQFEPGLVLSSYIPTTTALVTRNADVATITGVNFSSFWQALAGGAQVQATPSTVSGTRPLIQFDDGTANEVIVLRGNTTNPELYIVDNGAPQAQIDAGTIAANTAYNLFGIWNTNNCAAKLNNGTPVTDTSASIPTVTQARIGSDGTNYLNGHLASINYYTGNQIAGVGRYMYTRRKNKVVQPSIF
jgi:hypothetical protein